MSNAVEVALQQLTEYVDTSESTFSQVLTNFCQSVMQVDPSLRSPKAEEFLRSLGDHVRAHPERYHDTAISDGTEPESLRPLLKVFVHEAASSQTVSASVEKP